MTSELQQFSDTILLSCLELINQGWIIAENIYAQREYRICCPLVALSLSVSPNVWDCEDYIDLYKITKLIKQKTGYHLSDQDRKNFIQGFDLEVGDSFFALAGRRVRTVLSLEGLVGVKCEISGNE